MAAADTVPSLLLLAGVPEGYKPRPPGSPPYQPGAGGYRPRPPGGAPGGAGGYRTYTTGRPPAGGGGFGPRRPSMPMDTRAGVKPSF